ncbi:hypothetical protein [Nisaea sp.]|uniref:hypothetical protein n=1 Tax=Nisaea sp. TaxID=2024842 RepID=UPI003B521DE2
MVPGASEIVRALYGCWCLALNRPGAIELFDRSEAGFWRSFFAAVLALPGILISEVAHGRAEWLAGDFFDWISFALRYAVYWLAFPFVAVLIAEKIGALGRILDFLVPYNWLSLPFVYITCLFYLLGSGGGVMAGLFGTLSVLPWVLVVLLRWRWARDLLGVSGLMAAGFVLADEVVSLLAYLLLESIALMG